MKLFAWKPAECSMFTLRPQETPGRRNWIVWLSVRSTKSTESQISGDDMARCWTSGRVYIVCQETSGATSNLRVSCRKIIQGSHLFPFPFLYPPSLSASPAVPFFCFFIPPLRFIFYKYALSMQDADSGVFRIWHRGAWRARRARAYNGGLGSEPPAGSKSRAPCRGSGGRSPLKLKHFLLLNVQWKPQIRPFFSTIWKCRKSQRHIRCNLAWRF